MLMDRRGIDGWMAAMTQGQVEHVDEEPDHDIARRRRR